MSSLAYALTVPPTVGPRRVPFQTTTHYRFTVNYNDTVFNGGVNSVKVGAVPANAFVSRFACYVTTAFNAAGVNLLGVATTAAGGNFANGWASGDWVNGQASSTARCDLTSATYQTMATATGLGMTVTSGTTPTGTSGGWDIWLRYYQSSTSATTGKVTLIMEYVPDDDM